MEELRRNNVTSFMSQYYGINFNERGFSLKLSNENHTMGQT